MEQEPQRGICSGSLWSTSQGVLEMARGFGNEVTKLQLCDSVESVPHMAEVSRSTHQMNWNQPLLVGGRDENIFHTISPEDLISKRINRVYSDGDDGYSINQAFQPAQVQLDITGGCASDKLSINPTTISCPAALLDGKSKCHSCDATTYYIDHSTSFNLASLPRFSPTHFSSNVPFFAAQQPQFVNKGGASVTKTDEDEGRESRLGWKTCTGQLAALKKPRMELPSSLPTFKVRKEKLGDRITALQQLVSPFGKTDTASVLYEAIDYIKFLHEQVRVITAPSLHNISSVEQHKNRQEGGSLSQDLRSRGLCLVPLASTMAVTNDHIADFWTPTFGGSFN
ncbi:transcription factor bHLH112-like [Wolffia australiana]